MINNHGVRNWWRIGIFAAIFLISSFVLFVFALVSLISFPGAENPNGPTTTREPAVSWIPLVGAATTAVTAVSSLTGLVLSLRREKRDGKTSDLEIRQMEMNLEKSSLELEALKKGRHSA